MVDIQEISALTQEILQNFGPLQQPATIKVTNEEKRIEITVFLKNISDKLKKTGILLKVRNQEILIRIYSYNLIEQSQLSK